MKLSEHSFMDQQVIYLAGLVDGEGTFSIQINVRVSKKGKQSVHFNPRITMTLSYGVEVLDELVQVFGGNTYPYKDGARRWSLGGREAMIAAATRLLPYLRIKRRIAEQFIEALEIFPVSRKAHSRGERSWTLDMSLRVAKIALALNPYKKSPKTIDYLKVLEASYEGVA
jgi:LAGLIDADG endonuclease